MLSVRQTEACFCVYTFLSSTLLFVGSWNVVEALHFQSAGYWYALGLPACCILLLFVTHGVLQRYGAGEVSVWCHYGFLLIMMTMVPTPWLIDGVVPNYQELVLTRQGLEASAAPGWASVSCMSDADPQSIDVATDRYTYFTLADPQWRVASENYSVVKREEGWVWAVAPIEYVGPVHGCRTKYPLFAVCVDSPFNNVNCGWDGRRTGSWTYMRLLSAHGKIDDANRKPFWDEWVPNPYDTSQKVKLHHENLFEYDSVSYDEAARLVAEKQEAYDEFVMWYATAWFGLTVPLTLWACLWLIRKGTREAKHAAEAEAEQDRREKQHIMIQESALAFEPAPPPVPLPAPPPPLATPPSPPLSTPEVHPSRAPPSEYTPPFIWPAAQPHGHLPSEQGGDDGRAHFSGLGDRPLQRWEDHTRDETDPALHHDPWPLPTPACRPPADYTPRLEHWGPPADHTPPVLAEPHGRPSEQSWGGRGRRSHVPPALNHAPWQTRPFAPLDAPWRAPALPFATGYAHGFRESGVEFTGPAPWRHHTGSPRSHVV